MPARPQLQSKKHAKQQNLVERSRVSSSVPRVVERGLVPLPARPERFLLEINLEDAVLIVVDVGVDPVLVPVEAKDVEIVVERLAAWKLEDRVRQFELVLRPVGAPVHRRAHHVHAI